MLNSSAPLRHLAVCVTFHYVPERLAYLSSIVAQYIGMAETIDVYVVTNVGDDTSRNRIRDALPTFPRGMSLRFVTPTLMGHPFLLTWSHRDIFRELLAAGNVSHFLYTEDDLLVTATNILYWLRYREPLRKFGLIPSFFRVEQHPRRGWCSTDCNVPVRVYRQPRVICDDGMRFICMPNPYQGLYFLDRELMEEFAASPVTSPDWGQWGIREKAAAGMTFVNIPRGFSSRNVVPIGTSGLEIPEDCWVHHLPNNYANNPETAFGKLPLRGRGLLVSRFGLPGTGRGK